MTHPTDRQTDLATHPAAAQTNRAAFLHSPVSQFSRMGIGLAPAAAVIVSTAVIAYYTRDPALMPTGRADNPVPNERTKPKPR